MTYRGRVKNGMVILDAPAGLPEGAEVEVRLVEQPQTPQTTHTPHDREPVDLPAWARKARELVAQMPDDLPEDLADQHDHYIHGTPKR